MGKQMKSLISEIQALWEEERPSQWLQLTCLTEIKTSSSKFFCWSEESDWHEGDKIDCLRFIKAITGHRFKTISCSLAELSIQYAIYWWLIIDAQENHKNKAIKFIDPPNCYGGTKTRQDELLLALRMSKWWICLSWCVGNDYVKVNRTKFSRSNSLRKMLSPISSLKSN